jgi:hypothetical protein
MAELLLLTKGFIRLVLDEFWMQRSSNRNVRRNCEVTARMRLKQLSFCMCCHACCTGILGDEVKSDAMNLITGFKFSWCWGQLEMPAPPVSNSATIVQDCAAIVYMHA